MLAVLVEEVSAAREKERYKNREMEIQKGQGAGGICSRR
jgi:hypothetical protein